MLLKMGLFHQLSSRLSLVHNELDVSVIGLI